MRRLIESAIGGVAGAARSAVTRLWRECFGDSPEYIDFFLDNADRETAVILAELGGRAAGMVFLLPCEVISGGNTTAARYIYALGTEGESRGKGVARDILERANSMSPTILKPNDDLFPFYEKMGYKTTFFVDNHAYIDIDGDIAVEAVEPITVGEYYEARNAALTDDCVRWGVSAVRYALADGVFFGGGAVKGESGWAAAYKKTDDGIFIHELLNCSDNKGAALAVARMAGVEKCAVRLRGGGAAFGMARGVGGGGGGYLGLTLD